MYKRQEQGYAADSDEVKNLDEQVKSYAELISDTEDEIQMENAVVRQSKIERLKSDPMVKAREQADSVLEAASDEILGDLIAEGKQHIDEKLEEEKKKAEEAKEKKEELEEQIEARKEDRKEDVYKRQVHVRPLQSFWLFPSLWSDHLFYPAWSLMISPLPVDPSS